MLQEYNTPLFSPHRDKKKSSESHVRLQNAEFIHDVPQEMSGNKSLPPQKPMLPVPIQFSRSSTEQEELIEEGKEDERRGRIAQRGGNSWCICSFAAATGTSTGTRRPL